MYTEPEETYQHQQRGWGNMRDLDHQQRHPGWRRRGQTGRQGQGNVSSDYGRPMRSMSTQSRGVN